MPNPALSLQKEEYSNTLNEVVCPIDDNTLLSLCSANPPDAATIALSYSPRRRAQLAYFCYNRQHMRALAHTLILSCEKAELRAEFAGITDVIIEQAKAASKERENASQSLTLKSGDRSISR